MRSIVYLLGELEDEDVDWIVVVGRRQALAPGAPVISEGQPARHLFIVLDGTFSVTVAVDGNGEGVGGQREIGRLSRGDLVGEMSFVDGRPPSATVCPTDAKAIVLALPRLALEERLARDARFAARFFKALAMLLAERLRTSNRRVSGAPLQLADDIFDTDEVAPDLLDALFLAGQRFERLLTQTSMLA